MNSTRKNNYFQRQKSKARRQSTLEGLGCLSLFAAIGVLFFWALTTTLDDMTQRDCNFGVQAACEDLRK
tara:strand:+ start:55 stop:261 length:207 start_codon:yes stop_codon:yes gene_type:complete